MPRGVWHIRMRRGISRPWRREWRGSNKTSHGLARVLTDISLALFFPWLVYPCDPCKSVAKYLTYVRQDSAHPFRGHRWHRHERDCRSAAEPRIQGFRIGSEEFCRHATFGGFRSYGI